MYQFFKVIKNYSLVAIFRIVYLFAYVVPRDNRVWIFIGWTHNKSRETFAENPKYVYLESLKYKNKIKPIWITRDKQFYHFLKENNYPCCYLFSFLGIYYSLRAKYTLIGALMPMQNWKFSAGSKIVQLWHGKSIKMTGKNSNYSKKRYENKFLQPHLHIKYFRFIGISKYLSRYTMEDFGITLDDMLIVGAPKYDAFNSSDESLLLDVDSEIQAHIETFRKEASKKIIFWAPTFRPDGSSPLSNFPLDKFNSFLRENNNHCIVSLHPKFSKSLSLPSFSFSNLVFTQSSGDIYPLLNKIDLLITDYSSLATDFTYIKKPVIFFTPDINYYRSSMGIYDDLWSKIPGPRCVTYNDLEEALSSNQELHSVKFENDLFDYHDNQSSKRIVEFLLQS